ncbi:MAG: hypothetical protein AAF316_00320 [Cyanobacteria bacterium P01_A01_bin.80]
MKTSHYKPKTIEYTEVSSRKNIPNTTELEIDLSGVEINRTFFKGVIIFFGTFFLVLGTMYFIQQHFYDSQPTMDKVIH